MWQTPRGLPLFKGGLASQCSIVFWEIKSPSSLINDFVVFIIYLMNVLEIAWMRVGKDISLQILNL